jgi:hypothetical protein
MPTPISREAYPLRTPTKLPVVKKS